MFTESANDYTNFGRYYCRYMLILKNCLIHIEVGQSKFKIPK